MTAAVFGTLWFANPETEAGCPQAVEQPEVEVKRRPVGSTREHRFADLQHFIGQHDESSGERGMRADKVGVVKTSSNAHASNAASEFFSELLPVKITR